MSFLSLTSRTSSRHRAVWVCVAALIGLTAACGDDAESVDASVGLNGEDGDDGVDGRNGDSGENGEDGEDGEDGLDGDAGVDGEDGLDSEQGEQGEVGPAGPAGPAVGGGVSVDGAQVIALSLTGHDRLFGVVFAGDGGFYATGQIANDIATNADYSLIVAKFLPYGALDTSFGNDGIAVKNVAVGGTSRELARGIVLQSTGKIVIAGAAEHDPDAVGLLAHDTDIVLVRFNDDGSIDTTFGEDGVVTLDLNDGVEGLNAANEPTLLAGDGQWSLSLAADDTLVVHGTQRGEGMQVDGTTPRNDSDFALVRLTSEGVLDTTFSTDGKVTLDLQNALSVSSNASARVANVLADGSIVAAGYTTSDVLGVSTQQPVLYKVDTDGDFDASFATLDAWGATGVWHDTAVEPPLSAEAYAAALQSDGSLITMGYGPTNNATYPSGTGSDWISFRFSAIGQLDDSYGTDGATYIDAGGFGDNGRFVMVLPDDRVLGAGIGRAAGPVETEADGMLAMLSPDGIADEDFGPGGVRLYDVGGPADQLAAGALAPNGTHVVIVGVAGGETVGVNDDDSVVLFVPVD